MKLVVEQSPGLYRPATDDEAVAEARRVLASRHRKGSRLDSPSEVKDFLVVRMAGLEREVLSAVFLTAQHSVIEYREIFHGTLTQTAVYPREIVRLALILNAGAVILAHNHPSGEPEPSRADEYLTTQVKSALALLDVRLLDHIVVGGDRTVSMAERGLM